MADTLELLLLAVALAMDCFTVSTVCGVILRRRQWRTILRTAFFFGAFQAFMPYIGWLCTSLFASQLEQLTTTGIASSLLLFLGGKMIRESFLPEERQSFCPTSLRTQLVLAVATSIDALAIGISFACHRLSLVGRSGRTSDHHRTRLRAFLGHRLSARHPFRFDRHAAHQARALGRPHPDSHRRQGARRPSLRAVGGHPSSTNQHRACNSTRRELQPILYVGHQVRCPCLARGEAYRREADHHSRDHPADDPGAYRQEPCLLVCAYPDGRSLPPNILKR